MTPDDIADQPAFYVGSCRVTIADVAAALAVQCGAGEDVDDPKTYAIRLQDAKDILDRAFRYAQTRRQG